MIQTKAGKWTKEQVEQAFHAGKKSMLVRFPVGGIKDMNRRFVATLHGNYHVEESAYEVIVGWKPTETPKPSPVA